MQFTTPIPAQVGVSVDVEEGLQYIQHLGHLREDECLVTACLEACQQRCQLL